MVTRLSVNVNKIATIRNARGGNNPDVIQMAKDIERFGAEGITVHPRPDERHIRYADVYALKKVVTTEFNIEGYPSPEFMKLVLEVQPTQVTLVPDPPGVLTSNAGWAVREHFDFLRDIIGQLKGRGIRTSIFVDTDLENIRAAREVGTDRIELYTEPYAAKYHEDRETAVQPFAEAARVAGDLGLEVNAGHDLDLDNLRYLAQRLPNLAEVSIGHALICDALYLGMEETVRRYLECLR
ncbi:pyridoxine 5'-phosphate synthase [Porphyromonas levii]|uniref:Pyridoxine 5'-phosphate synthase n=1 Tax=Porphyromonas levii TaxID=28114 RepID=A0A4Y8WQH5_9PORP|nr:pyridoxine 5'-phosphate synthase [Porphyromonas levii]MBR8702469.1 Pyridoxine 5'-phosphate synthase [Porphyromonas levii]MBR8713464.1 Pyridoxine 5'-phosphate synthase [Porphyromonas levii]MBR8715499.1 Pyridoxine 5'-phosphate synthase [Porphyromonas levii]MBR8728024.1 Pyridoxine 5'-phosphate synthase [Porphyromonas levii]MBR8731126.1 Pyridoxine 5'-phosphate synthase [Porphyromonas levii]